MTGWSLRSAESSVFQLSLERGLGAQRRPSGQPRQREPALRDAPRYQFARTGKSLLIFRSRVKPRNQKYFASLPTQIRCISKPSRPDRAALRTSRNVGLDAVDAAASGEQ